MEDGDGEKIKLWNDPWLPTSSSYRFQSPINVLSGEAKVKDLMDEKGWNSQLIKEIFWEDMSKTILDIPLGIHRREDKLIWSLTDHGRFTVKSVHFATIRVKRTSTGSASNSNCKPWSNFWTLHPRKCQKLLMVLLTTSLPTKSNLFSKRITIDPN